MWKRGGDFWQRKQGVNKYPFEISSDYEYFGIRHIIGT